MIQATLIVVLAAAQIFVPQIAGGAEKTGG